MSRFGLEGVEFRSLSEGLELRKVERVLGLSEFYLRKDSGDEFGKASFGISFLRRDGV